MDNKCADCRFCTKLYVPPCDCYKDIPKDAYVCTVFLKDADRVQYLEDDQSICEMFTEKPDNFPNVIGAPIEMFVNGVWEKGEVINGYRFNDGIVTMKTSDGRTFWCGANRTDIYRKPKEVNV